MKVSSTLKTEIICTVHNTIDFCGNVQEAVQDVLVDTIHKIDDQQIQDIIFNATMTWNK